MSATRECLLPGQHRECTPQISCQSLILLVLPNSNDGIINNWEGNGLEGGNCAACHTMEGATNPYEEIVIYPPLLTDFTYDNLSISTNWQVYDLAGGSSPDLGLAGPRIRLDCEP